MKKIVPKIIRVTIGDKIFYHVSINPNNGEVTLTEDIRFAAVYKTEWDLTFIEHDSKAIREWFKDAKTKAIFT